MISKIKILSDDIVNKIAAGEVIDRPSSVIRELLENAIDANSTMIHIDIVEGGKKKIYISDNGDGMLSDDLKLAFKRHATSKIQSDKDLGTINSLGFRGEALPSIASVSKISAKSSIDGKLSNEIIIHSGEIISSGEIASLKGTTIEVCDLFYNVPARKKFLKSDESEKRKIILLLRRYFLSFPEINFLITNSGKEIYRLKDGDLEQRVLDVYGSSMLENLMKVKYSKGKYLATGYVGNLSTLKKRSGEQFIYINNRHISNRMISSSILSAYKSLISRGEFPFVCINLTMPQDEYDVNVHPMKSEVRFTNEWKIHHLIKSAIESSLADILNTIPKFDKIHHFHNQNETVELPFPISTGISNVPDKVSNYTKEAIIDRANDRLSDFNDNSINQDNLNSHSIWQIHSKYLITEINNGLVIIDQHVAHERILYEIAKKSLDGNGLAKQKLLFPQTITFQPEEYSHIIDIFPYLSKLGFDIREFSENTIIIEGIPSEVQHGNEKQVINDILDYYIDYQKIDSSFIDHMAATFACKASVKAGDRLTYEERRDLIDKLFATDHPYYCPHGRPIIINLSIDELDKRFERK